jgi:nucleotide-binding universal stress UspA family protein/nitroimidazol reductase NimA-like FMN-containing flavoprotein (pyridoxamine 5'-phosphate oxidase superfamily)
MELTRDWSVAQWRLNLPFAEAVRHVHSPLCGDHPRVVVGVDTSDQSVAAFRWAGWEAGLRGTQLHVVNAWEPRGFQAKVQRKQRQRQARRLMRQTLDGAFPQFRGQVEPVTATSSPVEVLVAASRGATLIVVASRKRGPFGYVFTSAAWREAAFPACPVAVVQDGRHDHPRPGKVVVGVDGSFTSWDALRWAATEAQYRGAELKVVDAAFLQPGTPGNLAHDTGQMLARMLGEVLAGPLAKVTASIVPEPACRRTPGDPVTRYEPMGLVLARMAADADVLVVGSHGFGNGSRSGVAGSVADDLLAEAACPVVVIPARREDEPDRAGDAGLAMERELAPVPYLPGGTAPSAVPDMTGLADHAGLEALPLEVCLRLLESVPVGRVSFCADGEVFTLPVNHVVDGNDVVFRTDRGSKLSAAERQNHVAFEADDYDPRTRTGWSVLVKGRAEVVREDSEIQRLSRLGLYPWVTAVDHPFWIRIRATSVTGRHTPLTTPQPG